MTPNPKPEELQSCPFCGNLPELDKGYVRCRQPSCAMLGSLFCVEKWNTRRPLVSKTTKTEGESQFVAHKIAGGDVIGECGEGDSQPASATEAALSFEAWFNSKDLPFVVMGGKKNAEYMTHCAWHARDSEITALREENERRMAALIALWNLCGEHDDPNCPEDDTCTCETVKMVNEALNQKPSP